MRIAQVAPLIESVPPRLYGGTERVVSWLTEELVRRGHDVTLFASGDSRTAARLVATYERGLRLDPEARDPLAAHIASGACGASRHVRRRALPRRYLASCWPPRADAGLAHAARRLDRRCLARSTAYRGQRSWRSSTPGVRPRIAVDGAPLYHGRPRSLPSPKAAVTLVPRVLGRCRREGPTSRFPSRMRRDPLGSRRRSTRSSRVRRTDIKSRIDALSSVRGEIGADDK